MQGPDSYQDRAILSLLQKTELSWELGVCRGQKTYIYLCEAYLHNITCAKKQSSAATTFLSLWFSKFTAMRNF